MTGMCIPFSVLRNAYQHALDTQRDNADQPETVRDYWPTCLRMAIEDHDGFLDEDHDGLF